MKNSSLKSRHFGEEFLYLADINHLQLPALPSFECQQQQDKGQGYKNIIKNGVLLKLKKQVRLTPKYKSWTIPTYTLSVLQK